MVFENGVKNIQAAAYNGARSVITIRCKDSNANLGFGPIARSTRLLSINLYKLYFLKKYINDKDILTATERRVLSKEKCSYLASSNIPTFSTSGTAFGRSKDPLILKNEIHSKLFDGGTLHT